MNVVCILSHFNKAQSKFQHSRLHGTSPSQRPHVRVVSSQEVDVVGANKATTAAANASPTEAAAVGITAAAEAPPAAKGGATTTPLSPALTLTTGMLEWAFPSSEGYDVEAMLRDALLQGGPHSHGASIQFQLPSTTDNESGGEEEEAGGDDAALTALAQLQQLNALDEEQPTGSSSSFPRVRGASGAAKSGHTKAQQAQQQGRQANQQHGGRRSGRRGSVGKSAGAQAPKRRTQASLKRPAQYELPPPGLGESNGVPRALLHTLAG